MTCKVEREKRDSISTSSRVLYCLLHKYTNDDFLKISEHFQRLFEGQTNISEHFPKIYEDFRRFPRKYRGSFDYKATHLSTFEGTM